MALQKSRLCFCSWPYKVLPVVLFMALKKSRLCFCSWPYKVLPVVMFMALKKSRLCFSSWTYKSPACVFVHGPKKVLPVISDGQSCALWDSTSQRSFCCIGYMWMVFHLCVFGHVSPGARDGWRPCYRNDKHALIPCRPPSLEAAGPNSGLKRSKSENNLQFAVQFLKLQIVQKSFLLLFRLQSDRWMPNGSKCY